ncbi:hypothetical protein N8I77_013662 [Diaporthe amygdali]|uniref:Uncharacterized protein n=1 Tax=Phomopsis amygdali TaxID=1214568 RepID=A0AAD9S3E2_PHOAM|nr:hypothetical protein N8I77_013662 [Diaporthe amygdali]
MVGLPNPSTLPLFQYYDRAKNALQDITYPDGFQPRRIEDYVLDTANWHPTIRTRPSSTCPFGTGPPHEPRSALRSWVGRQTTIPAGSTSMERASAGKLRIERATDAAVGYGVLALAEISEGTIVGEYMGKLAPPD